MSVILFLIFGLIVGALARLIVPGREPGGWLTSLVIGVAGAFLGRLSGPGLWPLHAGSDHGRLRHVAGRRDRLGGHLPRRGSPPHPAVDSMFSA